MTHSLHIIVNCSNRKRGDILDSLRLRAFDTTHDVAERARRWWESLSSCEGVALPATDVYSGDAWSIARKLPTIARKGGLCPQLWVASAGYGLIRATAPIHPYSATFASGPDSVALGISSGLSKGAAARVWWRELAYAVGPEPGLPRSVEALAREDPDAHFLVAASSDYVAAMEDDLLAALGATNAPEHFVIISSHESLRQSALMRHVIPTEGRLRTMLGGAFVSLHVRIARQILSEVVVYPLTIGTLIPHFESIVETSPDLPRYDNARMTDEEVSAYVRELLLNRVTLSGTALLRNLRESGRACEHQRFMDLYREVLRSMNSSVDERDGGTCFAHHVAENGLNPSSSRATSFNESAQASPTIARTVNPATSINYFIPDWDDLVDANYDFIGDMRAPTLSGGPQQKYAHELYPRPSYDGILVSKIVAESSNAKAAVMNALGVHRYLRLPPHFPVMGDCGAFGYIKSDVPPYKTTEILDYYTRLGFDYGVSIDHLIISGNESKRMHRYQLTISNAQDFLREHRQRELPWTPIGAVQGWNPRSYANAARQYVAMGYRYIGLGGLVRSKTDDILAILDEVRSAIPPDIKIHLFGIARLEAITDFMRYGVSSIDSASMLRKAWLGADRNYLTSNGWYAAIRVPEVETSKLLEKIVDDEYRTFQQIKRLERVCLRGLREYSASREPLSETLLDDLIEYDALIADKGREGITERRGARERLRRTLEERPWEDCTCDVCRDLGIDVVIFRGNNRNRRRGFHNTYVFYQMLQRLLDGEQIDWLRRLPKVADQLDFFGDLDSA